MDSLMHPLESILRHCAESAPEPWYPSLYVQATGVSRESLDPYLDQLRMNGLVHLTDWQQGRGQGYALTPQGQEVLHQPHYLAQLLSNGPLPPLDRLQPQPMAELSRPVQERREIIRDAMTRPFVPAVTYALIAVNLLWFLAGIWLCSQRNIPTDQYLNASLTPAVLAVYDSLGAMTPEDITVRHEWWRLLAACFVHFGYIHLGMNMFSLYFIGPLLERMWGSWRYLFLYLIAGLGGSMAMAIYSEPHVPGAGASGAILGIFATMIAWTVLNRRYLPRQLVSRWLGELLFLGLLNLGLTLMIPSISKAAHFGGSLTGLAVAVPVFFTLYGPAWRRWLALAVLIVGVCAGAGWFLSLVLRGTP
jgi:rhomboid protease GluP